ncbi:MAG TPA: ATP-binding protein [Streptosporangiaceae bacterium]|nr:ATP-binding protein [Streptosporangiaceae bacterium]
MTSAPSQSGALLAAALPADGDGQVLPDEPRWLAEVRLRAARRVLWLRHLWSARHYGDEAQLAISHSEVDRALMPPAEAARAEQAFYESDRPAAVTSARIAALARQPGDARLQHLVTALGLSPADTALLTLALACAADPAIARVFGYLLDVTEAADPTPALAAALFGGASWRSPGPDSALVRWLLAEPVAAGHAAYAPSTGWRADALLLPALLEAADASPAAAGWPAAADWSAGAGGQVIQPPPGPALPGAAVDEIVGFVRGLGPGGPPVEIELCGAPGSGRTTLAAHAAARLGARLVAVDSGAIAVGADAAAAATREARRACLDGSVICWERADCVPGEVWAAIPQAPLTFLCVPDVPSGTSGTSGPSGHSGPSGCAAIRRSVRCGPIGRRERILMWSSLAATPAPPAIADWALRPGEIALAARAAAGGEREVGEVCRRLLMAGTPELLTPLPLPFGWDDLVLAPATAAHLREFEAQARDRGPVLDTWGFSRLTALGRGTTALFAGPSGTGKTMAAQVLARSLGLDLYRVDLAGVVSKYIGETEKHLRELFEACERAPVLLLFDEADALFGKRTQVSDAHDRYANIEIDYVLQRMEQFDGIAVLATNRKGDLDGAFVRRLRFVIDFAPPGAAERERLWRIALEDARDAAGGPLVARLEWRRLAADLDLTGAGIKSAALAAAFLAFGDGGQITERHVRAAARRELEKQGIVVRTGQAGSR